MNSPSISRAPDLPITSSDALTTEIHTPKWKTTKILSSTGRLDLIGDGIQISLNKRGDKSQRGILVRPRVHGSGSKRKQTSKWRKQHHHFQQIGRCLHPPIKSRQKSGLRFSEFNSHILRSLQMPIHNYSISTYYLSCYVLITHSDLSFIPFSFKILN